MSWQIFRRVLVVSLACSVGGVFALDTAGEVIRHKGLGYVVVSPNGPAEGGGFAIYPPEV